MAECGAPTLICADISLKSAEETALLAEDQQYKLGMGLETVVVPVDVRSEHSVTVMVKRTFRDVGRFDVVVYAAKVRVSISHVPFRKFHCPPVEHVYVIASRG